MNTSQRLHGLLPLLCLAAAMVIGAPDASAGVRGGPKHGTDRALPFHTDVFSFKFEVDEPAVVTIRGDGSTDLDCFVYDSAGNEVDRDDDDTDTCLLSWHPGWAGYFRIEVRNLGDEENEYRLETN